MKNNQIKEDEKFLKEEDTAKEGNIWENTEDNKIRKRGDSV